MKLSQIQKLILVGLGAVVIYMFFAGLVAIRERKQLCDALKGIERRLTEVERERLEAEFDEAYYQGRCR